MKREVWYKGEVAVQDIAKHSGRWATVTLRKPLPHETEDQFPKLLRAPGGDQGLITLEKGEPGRKSQDLCSQSGPSVGSIPAVATNSTTPMTSPQELAAAGQSGSDNPHAKLSPSSAERWTQCTAAPALEAEFPDRILLEAAHRVRKLIPYLESMPQDEVKDHERRGMKLAMDLYNGKTQLGFLKPQDRQDILRTEGSEASRQGTRAHDFAEAILNGRRTIDSIPEEFQVPVKDYVEHCLSLVPEGETPLVEARVPLFYSPGETGTVDFAVVTEEKIIIRDLKYGSGKLVHSQRNPQLAVYALSLVRDQEEAGLMSFGPDCIIDIKAFQPNHHEAEGLPGWQLTLKDLEDFCSFIGDAAVKIEAGDVEFFPSDETCCWCPMKTSCEARAKWLTDCMDTPEAGLRGLELLAGLPDDDEIPDMTKKEFQALPAPERVTARAEFATMGHTLDDETLVAILAKSSEIEEFLADIKEGLECRVLGGEKIAGVKIVMGRQGDRKWRNEDEADTFLQGQKLSKEERYDMKLKGPAKIEKIPEIAEKLKKVKRTATRFAELISRSDAKKTIAHESDSRPAVESNLDLLPDDPEDEDDDGLGSDD